MHKVFDVGAKIDIEKFGRGVDDVRRKFINYFDKKYEDFINYQIYSANYVLLGITERSFRYEDICELVRRTGIGFQRYGKELADELLTALERFQPEKIDKIADNLMDESNYRSRIAFEKIYHEFVKSNANIIQYLIGENDYSQVAKIARAFKDHRVALAKYAIMESCFFPVGNNNFTESHVVEQILRIFAPDMPKKLWKYNRAEVIDEVRRGDIYTLMQEAKISRENAISICETYNEITARSIEMRKAYNTNLPEKLISSGYVDFEKAFTDRRRAEYGKPPIEYGELLKDLTKYFDDELREHALGFVFGLTNKGAARQKRFVVVDLDNADGLVLNHEMMHIISFRLARDPKFENDPKIYTKTGFHIDDYGRALNEFFTEYCTLKSNGKTDIDVNSNYDFYLPLVQPLFEKYEDVFIESYLGADFSQVYNLFGKNNFDSFAKSLDNLYKESRKHSEMIIGFLAFDSEPNKRLQNKIVKEYREINDKYYKLDEATLNNYANLIMDVKKWMARMQAVANEKEGERGQK